MKSFVIKHATAIIAVVLCIAIVVLAYVAFVPTNTPVLSAELEDLSKEINNDLPAPVEQINYVKTLPKSPIPSEKYLFTQQIMGVGNINLSALHATTVGTYIIAESDCKTGDIEGETPVVGIVKSDPSGNVSKILSLPSSAKYLSSQITPIGIVIAGENSSHTRLYIAVTDYDLGDASSYLLSYSKKATILPTTDSFILFCEGENESVIYSYKDGFAFVSLDATNIVKIFEYGSYYSLFCNTEEGYGKFDVDKKTFTLIRENKVVGKKLIDVTPLPDGEEQVLIAIESCGGIYASKYDKNFSFVATAKIGSYEIMGTGCDGQKIYLGVKGTVSGIISIKSDLSCAFSFSGTDFSPKIIHDYIYSNGAFFLLSSDENGKTALIKITESGTQVNYIEDTDKALLCGNANGTITVVTNGKYYDYTCVKMYGIAI